MHGDHRRWTKIVESMITSSMILVSSARMEAEECQNLVGKELLMGDVAMLIVGES